MSGVVLGIDAGGSNTRAVAVGESGVVLGRGTAGGANPQSNPPALAAERVLAAAREALGPRRPDACVLGLAGASSLTDPAVARLFAGAFEFLRVRVVTDAEVAFAAGTTAPDGTVLISGTGSIAMRIAGHRRARVGAGFGWLLGDEGSAFWIGREAVRATLRELQAEQALGALATSVLRLALEVDPAGVEQAELYSRLIRRVNVDAPIRLARFAQLVSNAVDPVAAGIRERAAQTLAGEALAVHEGGPVVLAGAILGTSVGTRVRELLVGHEVLDTRDGAIGAAWLAAVDVFGANAVPVRED
ncbi:BadF/BadG/BcrA/BcrD ATPase family protein [Actinokineospora sp. NBRC 105648]|uniref:N-acetylglucosamine kinase n=1 Tax=Actinokineospora sp. NBRC 105648 TaxID=3032206 RepID=UPI0024A04B54|nr:BadF/BadG/BcrA/BcrD ATPase family protein [Actinokineospora sp. NBRC 105648]GLZ41563.1 N-acetylglucosamine kinase [Actinokineospora sp. NBRC 105648]